MDGAIFSIVIWVVEGRRLRISLILESICCLLMSRSAVLSIKADNSQLPLLVVLRSIFKSGTRFIAFSKGRVMVIIILSTGCSPFSAMILIFGKVISGKRDDWI